MVRHTHRPIRPLFFAAALVLALLSTSASIGKQKQHATAVLCLTGASTILPSPPARDANRIRDHSSQRCHHPTHAIPWRELTGASQKFLCRHSRANDDDAYWIFLEQGTLRCSPHRREPRKTSHHWPSELQCMLFFRLSFASLQARLDRFAPSVLLLGNLLSM